MERLGTHPTKRSFEKDRSNTNGTCPDVFTVTAAETGDGSGGLAVIGTSVSIGEIGNAVIPERRDALRSRLAAVGDVAGIIVTRSTLLDANPEIDALGGELAVVDFGFPRVTDPRR